MYRRVTMATKTVNLADALPYLDDVRKARNITYAAIAELAGYPAPANAKKALETKNPTIQSVIRLAKAIGVNINLTTGEVNRALRLSVYNHAGGAGKTSLARDIGVRMGQLGLKVLLIDIDPQANLTDWLGVDSSQLTLEDTIFPTVIDNKPLPEPITAHGVDLIPAVFALQDLEYRLAIVRGARPHERLAAALTTLEQSKKYDVVIIDSTPFSGHTSDLAAQVADHLVVPVSTTHKAVEGLARVVALLEEVHRGVNPSLDILAVVPTQYVKNVSLHTAALENIERFAPGVPIVSPIRQRPAVYAEAHASGVPIPAYESNDKQVRDARDEVNLVTEELLELIGRNASVS